MSANFLSASVCVAAVLFAAGQAVSIEPRNEPQKQTDRRAEHAPTFRSASALLRVDVTNPNGETIGKAENLILDRGSGRVEYLLVKSGSVPGVGGRTIAVSFDQVGRSASGDGFTLSMTPEQVQRAAEFVPENWAELKERPTWLDDLDRLIRGGNAGDDRNADPYESAIKDASRTRVRGTIASVRRVEMTGREQIVVNVRAEDGRTREIILGPSWYVMGHDAAPMRGGTIDADVRIVETEGGGAARVHATSARVNGAAMPLRDDRGRPAWHLPTGAEGSAPNGQASDHARPARLMLMSDLIGAKARALDAEGGEIQDALVETRSGRVAIVCFDPNENFLGIADTIRCVPWQVATVSADGVVRFDADKAMLMNAVEMPSDAARFDGNSASLAAVYRVFRVEQPAFEPRSSSRADRRADGAAQAPMRWVEARRSGKPVGHAGAITDVRSVPLGAGEPPTHVVVIAAPEGGTHTVILGPAWYMEHQKLELKKDERISVEGRRIEIDGRAYVIADSIRRGDSVIELWSNNRPVWSPR